MATKDDLFELIHDEVTAAMEEMDHSLRMTALRDAGATAFQLAYEEAGGQPEGYDIHEMEFLNTLNAAATHTNPDGSEAMVDRVASMLATAAANAAIVAAAVPGTELEWITRLDDAVRDLHRPLHGEVRAAGTPFLVGGVPLVYPGQPVGPPEGWINCRCVLHDASAVAAVRPPPAAALVADSDNPFAKKPEPATSDECPEGQHLDPETGECVPDELAMQEGDLEARAFDTAKRKAMAKRHTAMPDGSFPIANAEDLRNAIQAIGRAKDPAKAKAHIRRRAAALGLTSLIPDSWSASVDPWLEHNDSLRAWEKSTSPPGTHDAPGWLTNPRETQRLRTYWTKGEGAAKIRWGQPGDFDRCRKQLVKYVQNPDYLAGTCANLHFVALGFWPNQGPHAGKRGKSSLPGDACPGCEGYDPDNPTPQGAAVTATFSAIAELDEMRPPREWFGDPGFDGPTALTVTDDGEVLGHIGRWDQCHVGYPEEECVPPPRSTRDYHHFRTGYVRTAGGDVAVGNITVGTGHADKHIGAGAAIAHYDNTGTAVADVAAGEDDYGIWVHGMLRPGVTAAQVHALRAGTPSGDWRTLGGKYELVAALVVNVPGFPIERPTETLAAGGEPLSLVAAGMVFRDPNTFDADRVAIAVIARLDERERVARNAARVAALREEINGPRIEQLVAAVGMPS